MNKIKQKLDVVLCIIRNEEYRICSECGRVMQEGYCINSGEGYYCSDKCLFNNMTEKEWEELYEDGGDSYWTTWYEDKIYSIKNIILNLLKKLEVAITK